MRSANPRNEEKEYYNVPFSSRQEVVRSKSKIKKTNTSSSYKNEKKTFSVKNNTRNKNNQIESEYYNDYPSHGSKNIAQSDYYNSSSLSSFESTEQIDHNIKPFNTSKQTKQREYQNVPPLPISGKQISEYYNVEPHQHKTKNIKNETNKVYANVRPLRNSKNPCTSKSVHCNMPPPPIAFKNNFKTNMNNHQVTVAQYSSSNSEPVDFIDKKMIFCQSKWTRKKTTILLISLLIISTIMLVSVLCILLLRRKIDNTGNPFFWFLVRKMIIFVKDL
jgi:hypothetical protein